MPSEVFKLTTEIVVSHASMTELTPEQLVDEIKEVYKVLASLEGGAILVEPVEAKAGAEEPGGLKKPPIPLKDIVKAKYVVCLEGDGGGPQQFAEVLHHQLFHVLAYLFGPGPDDIHGGSGHDQQELFAPPAAGDIFFPDAAQSGGSG